MSTPKGLESWLHDHGAKKITPGTAYLPGTEKAERPFVIATAPLLSLKFEDHRFNPRTPSDPKINELAASIRFLGLLTPLTCAYLDDGKAVVLIDGRHRYKALLTLAEEDEAWGKKVEVDLKIYHGLETSDIYILATYLNRTRRNLKKGEYYQVIVNIYDKKQEELEAQTRRKQTEAEIFEAISDRELVDRNFDLSVGRLVGLAAFDEEEGDAWYPYVGNHQSARFEKKTKEGMEKGYCPLTAGNLAAFLRFLCNTQPYGDRGEKRAFELSNVLDLGEIFQTHLLKGVESYLEPTATTVGCKHWPLVAFGHILRDSSIFTGWKDSPLAEPFSKKQKEDLQKVVAAYATVMDKQAEFIKEFKETGDQATLRKAWAYQTQKNLIHGFLKDELESRVKGFTTKALDGGE